MTKLKTMRKILLLFLFFVSFFKAQETIPFNHNNDLFYKGGFVNFYKEAHQVIMEKKLAPCDKKEALYHQEFIVTEKGEFKKIENHPNVYNANKCASDLLDKILPELKNWTPVEKNGNNITAKGLFAFFPDDLFENYKDGYAPEKLNADAGFKPNGLSSFRDEVAKRVDLGGFNGKGKITVIINFVVDIDGSVTDVAVEKSSGLKEFDERFVYALKHVKKKWDPAKYNGTPVRQRYKIPFSINFD